VSENTDNVGMSWSGFNVRGDRKSIDEVRRVVHISAQLDAYRQAFNDRIATKDAEITALKREVSELAHSLSDLYDLIARGMSVTDRDYGKLTIAATLLAIAIPDPAGGMPVETIWYETRRNEEPDGGMPVEVKRDA
jgi:hypothetical protein